MDTAWIISTGNELLIGRIANTNAQWLAERLTLYGFRVERIVTVPDEPEEEAQAFREALRARVVVSTGGLGPTFDDKTAEAVAAAYGRPLVLNEEALRMVREKYEAAGMGLTPERVKMAYLPLGSRPLYNPVGTAPGIYLEVRGTHVFVLPGPPREMKGMFTESVEPLLRRVAPKIYWCEAGFTMKGVAEADFAPHVKRAMRLSRRVYVKSHPRGRETGLSVVELHITASGPDPEELRVEVGRVLEALLEAARGAGGAVEKVWGPVVRRPWGGAQA